MNTEKKPAVCQLCFYDVALLLYFMNFDPKSSSSLPYKRLFFFEIFHMLHLSFEKFPTCSPHSNPSNYCSSLTLIINIEILQTVATFLVAMIYCTITTNEK